MKPYTTLMRLKDLCYYQTFFYHKISDTKLQKWHNSLSKLNDTLCVNKTIILDMGLKLKIVPDSREYTGFWKFGPYWPQK